MDKPHIQLRDDRGTTGSGCRGQPTAPRPSIPESAYSWLRDPPAVLRARIWPHVIDSCSVVRLRVDRAFCSRLYGEFPYTDLNSSPLTEQRSNVSETHACSYRPRSVSSGNPSMSLPIRSKVSLPGQKASTYE
jgi:hypothetical protein